MDLQKESICTFMINETNPSQMLPPCGCNHLTHFADKHNVHNINNKPKNLNLD